MADEKAIALDKLARALNKLRDTGLPLNDWQAGKKYKVNYPVLHENKIYRCIEAHTASSTFDETKWEVVSNTDSGLKTWVENTLYKTGAIVVYGNGIYQCITEHTSTSTFDTANWTNLSVGYVKKTLYTSNAYNTESITITTSESMLNKDFIIIKIAYSEDGTSVKMNKSYVLAPVVGEVHDFSYQESTTSYIALTGKILNNTTLQFNFTEAQNITKFKIISIDSLSIGDKAGTTLYSDSVKAVRRTLFEGSAGSSTTTPVISTIQLSDSYRNYDILGLYLEVIFNTESRFVYREIPTDQLDILINKNDQNCHISLCLGYYNTKDYFDILGQTSTETVLSFLASLSSCKKVVGIKYINENQYSTEEQLVGTWIDGKPLYQKTVEFTTPSENSVKEYSYLPGIPFSSIDKIISVDGWCARKDGWRVPHLFNVDNRLLFSVDWNKSNQKIYFYVLENNDIGTANQPATLTFRYTKTTN